MARNADIDINVNVLGDANKSISRLESRIIRFAGAVASALAVLRTASFPIESAAKFQEELINVRKTTGFTADSIDGLGKTLIELSKHTNVAAVDLAKIAAIAGQLGLGKQGADAIASFTETAARFSSVLDVTAENAASNLAKIANVFNIQLKESERIASAFNELSNQSTASGEELLNIVNRIGNIGGINIADALGLAAAGKDFGLQTEVIGTSFVKIISNMQTRAEEFAQFMNVSTQEWSQAVNDDAVGSLLNVISALNEMDSITQSVFIKQNFGGGRIFSVVDKLRQDLLDNNSAIEKYRELATDAFSKGTSAIQEQQNVLTGFNAQLTILKNRFFAVVEAAGKTALPALTKALKDLGDSLETGNFQSLVNSFVSGVVNFSAALVKAVDFAIEWASVLKLIGATLVAITGIKFAAFLGSLVVNTGKWVVELLGAVTTLGKVEGKAVSFFSFIRSQGGVIAALTAGLTALKGSITEFFISLLTGSKTASTSLANATTSLGATGVAAANSTKSLLTVGNVLRFIAARAVPLIALGTAITFILRKFGVLTTEQERSAQETKKAAEETKNYNKELRDSANAIKELEDQASKFSVRQVQQLDVASASLVSIQKAGETLGTAIASATAELELLRERSENVENTIASTKDLQSRITSQIVERKARVQELNEQLKVSNQLGDTIFKDTKGIENIKKEIDKVNTEIKGLEKNLDAAVDVEANLKFGFGDEIDSTLKRIGILKDEVGRFITQDVAKVIIQQGLVEIVDRRLSAVDNQVKKLTDQTSELNNTYKERARLAQQIEDAEKNAIKPEIVSELRNQYEQLNNIIDAASGNETSALTELNNKLKEQQALQKRRVELTQEEAVLVDALGIKKGSKEAEFLESFRSSVLQGAKTNNQIKEIVSSLVRFDDQTTNVTVSSRQLAIELANLVKQETLATRQLNAANNQLSVLQTLMDRAQSVTRSYGDDIIDLNSQFDGLTRAIKKAFEFNVNDNISATLQFEKEILDETTAAIDRRIAKIQQEQRDGQLSERFARQRIASLEEEKKSSEDLFKFQSQRASADQILNTFATNLKEVEQLRSEALKTDDIEKQQSLFALASEKVANINAELKNLVGNIPKAFDQFQGREVALIDEQQLLTLKDRILNTQKALRQEIQQEAQEQIPTITTKIVLAKGDQKQFTNELSAITTKIDSLVEKSAEIEKVREQFTKLFAVGNTTNNTLVAVDSLTQSVSNITTSFEQLRAAVGAEGLDNILLQIEKISTDERFKRGLNLSVNPTAENINTRLQQLIDEIESSAPPLTIPTQLKITGITGTGGADITASIKEVFDNLGLFAHGGIINGKGTATSDSNIIRVSDGESVLTAKATQFLGADFINFINKSAGSSAATKQAATPTQPTTSGVMYLDEVGGRSAIRGDRETLLALRNILSSQTKGSRL